MRIRGYDHDDNEHDGGSDRADQLYCPDYAVADSEQKQNTCYDTDSGKNDLQI